MNEMPPDDDAPEEVDELYRRAAALDPSRPSESVRRSIMDHAARVAAARDHAARVASQNPTGIGIGTGSGTGRSVSRRRWRPAIFGTLAAALLAALVVIPRFWTPPARRQSDLVETTAIVSNASAPPPSPATVAPPKLEELPSAGRVARNAVAAPRAVAPRATPGAQDSALDESSRRLEQVTVTARKATPAPPALQSPQSPQSPPPAAPQAELAAAARFAPASRPGLAGAFQGGLRVDASAALRRAAQVGDIAALNQAFGQSVDVNGRDDTGRTALMWAILNGQGGAVDALLAHGADPNVADAKGESPLEAALDRADPSIISALRRAGARANP